MRRNIVILSPNIKLLQEAGNMRLGSMQTPKEYKFIQELIIEGIWPFSQLRSPYNFFLLSLVYFFWGVELYAMFSIPPTFLIAGSLAGIGISVWTFGIFQYASRLRDAKIEQMTPVKRKFLVAFMEEMFHDRSLFLGIIGFIAVVTYFWTSNDIFGVNNILWILEKEFSVQLHPFLLAYVFIIAFDVCYRFGLSAYISVVLLRRNFSASKILNNPKLKKQIIPRDLYELERVDRFHFLSFVGGLFFLPLSLFDPILFLGLITFLILSLIASLGSILQLRILQVKAIPEEVLKLLVSSRFAYIGTISKHHIPHVTPSLFVFDGRRVFFATSIKSQKVKNLQRHRNLAVCIHRDSSTSPSKNRGVLIRGQGRVYGHNILSGIFFVITYGIRMFNIRILYKKKYSKYMKFYQSNIPSLPGPWLLRPILSRTIVEVIPRSYTFWEGTKFSKAAVI
ncbi:MAG: pyridoxamine 5'-phosphate oxidase family protein [Candidatus Hodarchaeales archaeon]|jgi:hypothetical protein